MPRERERRGPGHTWVARHTPPGYLDAYRGVVDLSGEEPPGLAGMRRWLGLNLAGMKAQLARVLRVDKLRPFNEWCNAGGAGEGAWSTVVHRLAAEGFDVLVADLAPLSGVGGGDDIHAVKVIVPGLEVETMSYRRVGERNVRRLMENAREPGGEPLAGVGPAKRPAGALPVLLTAAVEARLGGAAWLDPDALERARGELYVLYREPGRHAAPLALEEGR